MSLPTLFLKGNLEATDWSPKQSELDELVPLDYIMQWFEDRIPGSYGENAKIESSSPADRILILQSSTGSGKSTAIPPELFHRFFERTRKNIACTQPRTLTAIDIPKNTIPPFHTKEMLSNNGFPNREALIYGKNIGTQTGVFTKRPYKGIVFMTPGIIVQQMNVMSNEDFMNKYSIIIIDEAHERSLQIDTVLYMLKKFINTNYKDKNCPFMVVMSATFDTIKFCNYLLSDVPKAKRYENIIKVKGFTYPVQEVFLNYDSQNYVQSIVDLVIEIHKNNSIDFMSAKEIIKNKKLYKLEEDMQEDKLVKMQKFRDILIFVKGPGEIVKLKNKLNKLNTSNEFFKENPILPLGLTGDAVANQSIEYRNTVEKDIKDLHVEVFSFEKKGKSGSNGKIKLKKPTRRVIIATNVAETGITIETLKYVIEPGFVYSKEYNPCFATEIMVSKPVTKSMYKQRRGRVGRKAPGTCYVVYTKNTFENMQEDQYPDIVKDEITLDLLSILIKEVDPENKVNELDLYTLFNVEQHNADLQTKGPGSSTKKTKPLGEDFVEKINKTKINIFNLDLLDLPSADSLHYSMEKLYTLGAINKNSIPTLLGFIINKFRFIRIESIKMILSGYAWQASIEDLITMAAFLESSKEEIFSEELSDNYKSALEQGKFTLFGVKKVVNYSEFKSDLYVSDDFIKYILIFNEFQKNLSEISIKNLNLENETESTDTKVGNKEKSADENDQNIVEMLQEWGNEYGINVKGLLNVLEVRESIISSMIMIGLNPFENNSSRFANVVNSFSDQEKLKYVCNIKQCIFEGYKHNMAVWNSVDKRYYTRKTHLPLQITNEYILSKIDIYKFGDTNPKYIVYDKLMYFLNTKTNLYEPKVTHVSVLDGYITVDPNFDSIL